MSNTELTEIPKRMNPRFILVIVAGLIVFSCVSGAFALRYRSESAKKRSEKNSLLTTSNAIPTVHVPAVAVEPPVQAQGCPAGTQCFVSFDELSPNTDVRNWYSDIKFSSGNGFSRIITYNQSMAGWFGFTTSRPNVIGVDGRFFLVPIGIYFPKPVNHLSFNVAGLDADCDSFTVDIYESGSSSPNATFDHPICGWFPPPFVHLDFEAMGYTNITAIVIRNIVSDDMVGLDDFVFTVGPPSTPTPTPTPTPNPSPTPPHAPTLLSATAGDEEVSLQWTATLGANCQTADPNHHCAYKVKQVTESGFPITGGTATVSPSQTNATVRNLTPNVKAYFAVSAVNENLQESEDSNILSATPLHKCGLSQVPIPTPSPTPWNGGGWHLESQVSANDGLVIRNVSLNGRPMAAMMSLPYFEVKTTAMPFSLRGELTPDNPSATAPLRTRLVGYDAKPIYPTPGHVAIDLRAQYVVDNLSSQSKSCLFITQEYEFDEMVPGDGCELSGKLPCSRFYPKTSYTFVGRDGEHLQSLTLPQRLHFKVLDNEGNGGAGNTVGAFKDCDFLVRAPLTGAVEACFPYGGGYIFLHKDNPIHWETDLPILQFGQPVSPFIGWDNFHQSAKPDFIEEPSAVPVPEPGCPDCVHIHWRWGSDAARLAEITGRGQFGSGRMLKILAGSNQDLMAGIVKWNPNEEHPFSFESLKPASAIQPLRAFQPPNNTSNDFNKPFDVVFWYIGTGHQDHDEFFNHGGFFNPNLGINVPRGPGAGTSSAQNVNSPTDGPTTVTFGYLYKDGEITINPIDPASVAPLPSGYVALNSTGYSVTTDAVFSGTNIVSFNAASVTDPVNFANLRILHAERDPFDPDGAVWLDRTILAPDPLAPDFNTHTINARVNDLGKFVIAIRTQPPTTNTADLSVNIAHSPEPVVADNNLVYTIVTSNNGPQPATGVGLINPISSDAGFVSVSASQGTCKFTDGTVYCKLNSLPSGSSATVTVTVKPTEGANKFSTSGTTIHTEATVGGNESDPNSANNNATDNATALPSSNARPSVTITSPAVGTTVVGPVNVTILAQASDSDGSISQVDFYDGDAFLGSGVQTSTANQYRFEWANAGFGAHVLRAIATDSGGKQEVSNAVNILINGPATINITNPATGSIVAPGMNIPIAAVASTPNGSITKVEFVTDGRTIGDATFVGGTQYQINWANVQRGNYVLSAIATDNAGIQTISPAVNLIVTNPPSVTISRPVGGTLFASGAKVVIDVQAQGSVISKVEFYGDGILVGTGVPIADDKFTFLWQNPTDGIHTITAVATDDLGLRTTSSPVDIGVNTPTSQPGEFIWFDDSLPTGAVKHADGDVDWYWVDANPGAFSGTKAHQSRSFGQVELANNVHEHSFDGATTTLPISAGDSLFTYVFLDPNDKPREIMLQWKDVIGWEHRAYWGQNRINLGVDSTASRRYWGQLPKAGTWQRLEVPADLVGLAGSRINGMKFTLDGGRATFDLTGKRIANSPSPPPTPPGDSVWFDDELPPGAITAAVDDNWNWVTNLHYTGVKSHQTRFDGGEDKQFRQHSFTGAQTPMQVNPGDVLFTYVYLGDVDSSWPPYNAPDQIMLQWYDGTSWEHRAFWGVNFIGAQLSIGVQGTEGQRYMGGLPAVRGWYRLEVPASYVGLEGKLVSGMAFSAFRNNSNPFVAWDRSGKSAVPTKAPRPLSATSGVWRSHSNTYGYAFEMPDVAPPEHQLERIPFYVYPNQAAGTVPMFRFRKSGYEYFYSTCRTCPIAEWQYEGIAFYVYPKDEPMPPGTVPLYLYHDAGFKYLLTINQSEGAGMSPDGIWAYVPDIRPVPPTAPTLLEYTNSYLHWRDNSWNELGFKIERDDSHDGMSIWTEVATVSANTVWFKIGSQSYNLYRVRAYNAFGNSDYSNDACNCDWTYVIDPPLESAPEVSIITPLNGEIVGQAFNIRANAFDADGNGTIEKVEFFANGVKLGEVGDAPYVLTVNLVSRGSYILTVTATDNTGMSTTSSPVVVTFPKLDQTIAFDQLSDKTYGDAPFQVVGTASSGLPVTFSVVSGPATLAGNTVTITGAGAVTVRASQPGDANYNPAANVDRTFNVQVPQNYSETYRASTDFSTVQGYRNWYYLDSNGSQMSYEAANSWWHGSETYLLIWASGGHPGSYLNSVRQWRAPANGSIHITGNASDLAAGCGDGVTVSIKKGTQVLWQQNIDNGNDVGFNYDLTTTVVTGDQINFVINPRGDCWCDSTGFDPTIVLTSGSSTPFSGSPITLPGTIQIEDFDNGGEGIAYHDTSAGNAGGQYRTNTDVDIGGNAGGYNVGWTISGEWTKYSVNVAGTGTYAIEAVVSGVYCCPNMHVEVDGVDVTGRMAVPNTGGWGAWQTISKAGVNITAGYHVVKFVVDSPDSFLIDSLRFVLTSTGSTPFSGTPISLPGTIQIEDFDNGGEGVAYHDTTAGNAGGQYRTNTDVDIANGSVGWTVSGEWTAYSVNVATGGTYTTEAVVSGIYCCPNMHVEIDGVNVTGPMSVPNTGGWGTWQTISRSGVNIAAGYHVVKFVVDSPDGFLIDSIRIVPSQ